MSNIQSVGKILTAKALVEYEGAESVKDLIMKRRDQMHITAKATLPIKNMDNPIGAPVHACIDFGRWIANCECGGAEAVDYDEPVFFCFSCGNRSNGNRVRPVIFPDQPEREEIERLVLERPVDDMRGLTDYSRATGAKPLIKVMKSEGLLPLSRSWEPHETVADLQEQNKPIEAWKASLKKGGDS